MKRLASLAVLFLALLPACAEQEIAPPPPMPPQPVEQPLGVEIDAGGAARIKGDVTYLASPELGGLARMLCEPLLHDHATDRVPDKDGAFCVYLVQEVLQRVRQRRDGGIGEGS